MANVGKTAQMRSMTKSANRGDYFSAIFVDISGRPRLTSAPRDRRKRAEILSTATHVSFLQLQANEGRTPPRRLLAENVIGDKALSYFLSNRPWRSRGLAIVGSPPDCKNLRRD
jgi:hypothetical protein